jgi:hypothetical protein
MTIELDVAGVNLLAIPAVTGDVVCESKGYRATGTMSFRVEAPVGTVSVVEENPVLLHNGATVYYGGLVKTVTPVAGETQLGWWAADIECQDHTILASQDIIDVEPDLTGLTDKQIITAVFAAHGTKGIIIGTECQVLATSVSSESTFLGMQLDEFMDALCEITGGSWYVGFDKHLHYFVTESENAPHGLSDTPNNTTTYGYDQFVYGADTISLKNAVYYIPGEGGDAVPTWYTDDLSIAAVAAACGDNGRREACQRDDRITLQSTLDDYGAAFLAANAAKHMGSLICYQPGLRGGMTVGITNAEEGLSAEPFVITSVRTTLVLIADDMANSAVVFAVAFGDQPTSLGGTMASIAGKAVDVLPQVDAALANAIAADFANGIIRPQIVNALPSLPDAAYPDGFFVVLTTDRKLYISTGTTWEVKVDGSDMVVGSIGAAALSAVIVLASSILTAAAGARCEMSNLNGFVAYDSLGAIRVQIPITDDPVSFIAAVQATTLTVIGSAEFQAAMSLGKSSTTTLQAGVQPPNAAPILVAQEATGLNLSGSEALAIYGEGYRDSAGGSGGASACFVAIYKSGSDWYVGEWLISTGVLDRSTKLTGIPATWTWPWGITRVGTAWFLTVYAPALLQLQKYTRATGAYDSQVSFGSKFHNSTSFQAGGGSGWTSGQDNSYPVKTDGTGLYILGNATSLLTMRVANYNTSLTYQSSTTLTVDSTPSGATAIETGGFEIADYGDGNGVCFWANLRWVDYSASPPTEKRGATTYQNKSDGSLVSSTSWVSLGYHAATQPNGLIWDGTNFRQADEAGVLHFYTNFTTASTNPWHVCYSWRDDAGTAHETTVGPRATPIPDATLKRRQLSVTNATIPVGGADDPNKVRGYMVQAASAPAITNYHLQFTDALMARTLVTYDSAGAADPATNNFPGGTGALMQSADGASWWLRGNGTAKLPNGSAGGCLGAAMLNLTADISSTATAAAPDDVDAANLVVTFVAPPSGMVLVMLSGQFSGSGGWDFYWGVREGAGTALAGQCVWSAGGPAAPFATTVVIFVTGLSAGTHTLKWCHYSNGSGTHIVSSLGGNHRVPATMTVFAT